MTSMTQQNISSEVGICHDARYEGEFVLVYDHEGKIVQSLTASLYKGTPLVVKQSGGCHMQTISEIEAIIINPKNLSQLTSIMDYGWFVKDRILKDNNLQIHTAWKPIFLPNINDIASIPTRRSSDEIYIVPAIRSSAYAENRTRLPMVPLLETLVSIDQMYSGMTLQQIGAWIQGGFDPSFSNSMLLMTFLFEHYREELTELCKRENTPLHKLHQSLFNLTYGHNIPRSVSITDIRVKKQLEDVYMIPLSRLFREKTYGDVPWLIWDRHEKNAIEKRKDSFILYPLGFFKKSGQIADMKEAIYFQHVIILPEIIADERRYPAGGIMGMVQYKDGSEDTLLRGELFEDTTLREQIILSLMFVSFIKRTLTPSADCTNVWRNFSFHSDQIAVRKPFIRAIQASLFASR